MRRCSECARFVPIVQEVKNFTASIKDSALVIRTGLVIECEVCGLDIADGLLFDTWPIAHPTTIGHVLSISKQGTPETVSKTSQGRRYYGVKCNVHLSCSCGLKTRTTVELTKQASDFESLW